MIRVAHAPDRLAVALRAIEQSPQVRMRDAERALHQSFGLHHGRHVRLGAEQSLRQHGMNLVQRDFRTSACDDAASTGLVFRLLPVLRQFERTHPP